jgi:tetratricopeptide (TPR) repeat protein
MNRPLTFLLLAVCGCAAEPEIPDSATEPTATEQKLDPLKTGRELLDQREKDDNLDRAVRILEWHAGQKPKDEKVQLLAAEAYSRSLEVLGDRKKTDKTRARRLLTQGKLRGQAALDLAPADGVALYWRACLLLHEADIDASLGKAKEAIAMLEKAEAADPKTDDGGPARMKGRVYAEMPLLVGGSLSKAVANYKKSLAVAPDFITTRLWLGEAYADGKRPDLARKELEWVVAAKPRAGHEKEDGEDIQKAAERLKKLKP